MADTAFRELIALVGDALELPPDQRDTFLRERCGDNGALLAEARSLLALDGSASEADITAVVWHQMMATANRVAGPVTHPGHIGPYQVTGLLGEGGMGVVYSARQEQPIRREVAVKVLRSGLATPRAMARFELERQTLARLDHPGIARVYEAGATDEGLPYLAMEWVHGEPITRHCIRKSLDTPARLALMRQVCLAVHHAHQKGIIHRDLKPGNILVAEVDGVAFPRVIDFGIARIIDDNSDADLTMQGARIGTVEYMSPEQAVPGHGDVDVRSDIYSLGVVLYELITGALPFAAEELRTAGPVEMRRLMLDTDPPPPSARVEKQDGQARLARDIDWVVMTALRKDPDHRYQSADALALDLLRIERNQPVSVAPPSLHYRFSRFIRRNRTAVIAAGAVVATLLAGIIATTLGFVSARRAQASAELEASNAGAVTSFITDMLAAAEPDRALGNVVTAQSVLDAAAARIDSTDPAMNDLVLATIRFTLANSYREIGRYDEAIDQYQRALATWREVLPESDERIARSLHGIGNSMWRKGDLHGALRYAQQVLTLRQRTVGRFDARYSEAVEVLGSVNADLGNLGTAESLYREAVSLDSVVLEGAARTQLGTSLNNLATGLMDLGRWEEAAGVLRQSLANRLELLPPEDPRIAITLGNLGKALTRSNQIEAALDTLRPAVALGLKVMGDEHPSANNILFTYAEALHRDGMPDSAMAVLGRVREHRVRLNGERHWLVGQVDVMRGVVEIDRGDTLGGLRLMMGGWESMATGLGERHPAVIERAGWIADVVERREGTQPASIWRARARVMSEPE